MLDEEHSSSLHTTIKLILLRVLCHKYSHIFLIIILLQFLILNTFNIFHSQPAKSQESIAQDNKVVINYNNYCRYGRVYVYDLPPMFNQHLVDGCDHDLDPWVSRCNAVSNTGLGPKAIGPSPIPENLVPSWYWTDQYAGEIIFHSRILNHKCRTMEPESATAFYIPFYAGLAVGKYIITNYTSDRDKLSERMLEWVHDQPSFRRSNGSDHFITIGRTTWDFRRVRDEDWGSSFFNMPLMKRVVRLGIEEASWDPLEISVPYPTGFHPKSKREMDKWLTFVRSRNRTSLYTFVGGKRELKDDFRTILLSHCYNESSSCRVVDCSVVTCQDGSWKILEAFLESDFCLQPRGETFTRKSMFDCMLAGSIPVFFWRESISGQYEWFLGNEPEKFSVFIDRKGVRSGKTSIREVLEGYNREEVRRMREKVLSLVPKFVYSDEDGIGEDAFEIAINRVLKSFHDKTPIKQY